MSSYLIEIIKNNSIHPIFFKANKSLIHKYKLELGKLNDQEKKEFIKQRWIEEFCATPKNLTDSSDEIWTHIEFFSEKDMMLFLIGWKN
jgi:hypothetical protein